MEPGYFYFISDDFFDKFPQQKNLMQNKQAGHRRPCFFCFSDPENNNLFWCVPISSKVNKFDNLIANKRQRLHAKGFMHSTCDTIRFANVQGYRKVFLIQNMFPVTAKYISNQYIDPITQKPITISPASTNDICIKAQTVLNLVAKGHSGLVCIDIMEMRQILLTELEQENPLPTSLREQIKLAQNTAKLLNDSRHIADHLIHDEPEH